jgi:hypothetical protein
MSSTFNHFMLHSNSRNKPNLTRAMKDHIAANVVNVNRQSLNMANAIEPDYSTQKTIDNQQYNEPNQDSAVTNWSASKQTEDSALCGDCIEELAQAKDRIIELEKEINKVKQMGKS